MKNLQNIQAPSIVFIFLTSLFLMTAPLFGQNKKPLKFLSSQSWGESYTETDEQARRLIGFVVGINDDAFVGPTHNGITLIPYVGLDLSQKVGKRFWIQHGISFAPRGYHYRHGSTFIKVPKLLRGIFEVPIGLRMDLLKDAKKTFYFTSSFTLNATIDIGIFSSNGLEIQGFSARTGLGYFWNKGKVPQRLEINFTNDFEAKALLVEDVDFSNSDNNDYCGNVYCVYNPTFVGVYYYIYPFNRDRKKKK